METREIRDQKTTTTTKTKEKKSHVGAFPTWRLHQDLSDINKVIKKCRRGRNVTKISWNDNLQSAQKVPLKQNVPKVLGKRKGCGGGGGGGFSSRARISRECSTIHSLPAVFLLLLLLFLVEISSRTPFPLFRSGSVHSRSASWDYRDQVFPDELRVSAFPDRFLHYAWTAA